MQWITNTGARAPYPFNTANAVITRPGEPLVRVLEPGTFYSFDDDTAAGNRHDHDAAAGAVRSVLHAVPDGYIGAVRRTANWTANWTYGIDVGNRASTPWWEQ